MLWKVKVLILPSVQNVFLLNLLFDSSMFINIWYFVLVFGCDFQFVHKSDMNTIDMHYF